MNTHSFFSSLREKCVFLLLIVVISVTADKGTCDPSTCPGPLEYYRGLKCKPVYENPDDCCAIQYDCSHLSQYSKEKCYVNGHEYSLGEQMRSEDANSCDIGCYCSEGYSNKIAVFTCAAVDCFGPPMSGANSNCFLRHVPNQCCPGPMVCPEEGKQEISCEVDGKTYKDGEYFIPPGAAEGEYCYCQPGFAGVFEYPFCGKNNHSNCDPMIRQASDVHENCPPVYYSGQSPQKDCNVASRCQNERDAVIESKDQKYLSMPDSKRDSLTCKFGTLTMRLGEELNQATHYSSVCVKCVCDVPPLPTCQRLPDSECDVTKHPSFDSFN